MSYLEKVDLNWIPCSYSSSTEESNILSQILKISEPLDRSQRSPEKILTKKGSREKMYWKLGAPSIHKCCGVKMKQTEESLMLIFTLKISWSLTNT